MSEMQRQDLMERLRRLDEDADLMFEISGRFRIVIVGGGALVLRDYIARATHDIDVLGFSHALDDLMKAYDINSRVQAYENNFPYNYEDRLELLWQGRKIDFYTASLEDIVIAKLCSNRPSDRADVEAVADRVDWVLLDKLATGAGEARASALNERNYRDFLMNYRDYIGRHRQ